MLKLVQKTKLSNAEKEDFEEFLQNLKIVDFNNRNEESKYKWKWDINLYIFTGLTAISWLGKIIIDAIIVASSVHYFSCARANIVGK